ncbi:MAG: hypothetical protein K1X74_11920 [Pirellulales bacterium]|nr:hypothetical protein [Pirellulales bacterium]
MSEQKLLFLCPSGHQLHGPLSLAGRAGQCPHCGVRFRIPTLEEMAAAEEEVSAAPPEEQPGETSEEQAEEFMPPPIEEFAEGELIENIEIVEEEVVGGDWEPATASPVAWPHSMAVAFEELWPLKAAGVTVEIHLRSNETLTPDHYAASLSQRAVGVFAVRDESGLYTLAAIPWDQVRRVDVRGVDALPENLFE